MFKRENVFFALEIIVLVTLLVSFLFTGKILFDKTQVLENGRGCLNYCDLQVNCSKLKTTDIGLNLTDLNKSGVNP